MREKSLLFVLFIIGAFLMSSLSYAQDKINVNPNKRNSSEQVVNGPVLDNPVQALSESFEGVTFPPTGWVKISSFGNITNTWQRSTNGTTPLPGWTGTAAVTVPPGGGTACAYVTYGDVGTSNSEWLITPQITNVGANDSLSFWVRYIVPTYADSMGVWISTTTQTVAAMTTQVWKKRFFGAVDTGWVQYKFKLTSFVPAGSNIYIGFREFVANNIVDGSAMTLDLVNVTVGSAPLVFGWSETTTPVTTTLASVSAVDHNVAWACGYTSSSTGPPQLVKTVNGGTWTSALGTGIPANTPLFNIWAVDANTALTTGSTATGTFVYRTTNGGSTWTQVFTQAGGFINVILFSDANTGWMQGDNVGGRWSLWRTTNGGVNWDSTGRYLPGAEAGWNNSAFMSGNNIWFGTNSTKVYYSSNAGVNWTSQPTTGEANGYAVTFNTSSTGFVGGATMQKSTNNGSVWATHTAPGTGNVTGLATNGTDFWYTRQSGNIIYTSSNAGTSWGTAYTSSSTGTFTHITKARNSGSNPYLFAVKTNGVVAKYGTAVSINPISEVADNYQLSQNYPNPFNPTTKINFSLPKSGFVTLKVYDILGKEVATLVNEFKNNGTYAVDFNATNLASGVYLYRIESEGFVASKRMMLIK